MPTFQQRSHKTWFNLWLQNYIFPFHCCLSMSPLHKGTWNNFAPNSSHLDTKKVAAMQEFSFGKRGKTPPSSSPRQEVNFSCCVFGLVNRTERFRKCGLFSLLQQAHKSQNSALCLPQKPEIQTESNKGTSVLVVHTSWSGICQPGAYPGEDIQVSL